MSIKPSEEDLVFYHPSTTGWDKQNQLLRDHLVFYHFGGWDGLKT